MLNCNEELAKLIILLRYILLSIVIVPFIMMLLFILATFHSF